MRIAATDMNGKVIEVEAINYMAVADRVAFEKQFGKSSVVMSQWQDLFDRDAITDAEMALEAAIKEHGKDSAQVDEATKALAKASSEFRSDADPGVIREEFDAFFSWRELRRHHPKDLPPFDAWVDNLAELKISGRAGSEDPPTTAPAAPQT